MGTVFKNTLKNLFRSLTFWLMAGAVLIGVLDGVRELYFTGGGSWAFESYVQLVSNSCTSSLLTFSMPLFAIVTVCLTPNRDYGDSFFEIEKAANQKPFRYVCARFLAVVSVNLLLLILSHALFLHVFTAFVGGVDGLTPRAYLKDSAIRALRIDLLVGAPCLLFYIGISFLCGALFKSGRAAALGGVGYLMLYNVLSLFFRWDAIPAYFDYFAPVPRKLQTYFHYYDSPLFENCKSYFQTSPGKALFCIVFLLLAALGCMSVCYLRTRRRSI